MRAIVITLVAASWFALAVLVISMAAFSQFD